MTIVIEGNLTLDQMATHVLHEFTLPSGVGTLKIRFSYTPVHPGVGDIPHQLSISVYGPDGARGTRHNNSDQSPTISTHYASPGYLPGRIEPGRWVVEVDVHRILAPGNISYRIEVDWQEEETSPSGDEDAVSLSGPRRWGAGWYKGDLHGHTLHSDGILSVAEYLELALERGYDFVALTDHNTVSGLAELERRAGDAITVIGGVELTTYYGHALALGTREWTEWRVRDGETMSGRAQSLMKAGQVFIIAHPKSEGHPFCTGCRWAYADLFPGPARYVEVWNGRWTDHPENEQAVALFYHWLNKGYRMVATAGTDTHMRFGRRDRIAANFVFAQDNTEKDILAAVGRGQCYISSGPRLECSTAFLDGQVAGLGDIVPSGPLSMSCSWSAAVGDGDLKGLKVRLIRRGVPVECWSCGECADVTVKVDAKEGDWFVWEVRDENGHLHAITNPVHVGVQSGTWR